MNGSTLWKLILSALIVSVAVLYLIPYQDTEFKEYILAESNQDEAFTALVAEADAAYQAEGSEYHSIYIALRTIALERDIDLSQYFPHLLLESSLRNTERRNQVLLDELLKRSKARLQPGLDLKGGVVFVFELDLPENATLYENEADLSKAIDIIGDRINSLGVTEPVIRTTGENRIEVQLPGVSTKENPEIQKAISKPARLEFRLVHRTAFPTGPRDKNAPIGYEVKALNNEDRNGVVQTSYLFVKRIPEIKGDAIEEARAVIAEFGGYEILMDFTSAGGKQFEQLTREIANGNTQTSLGLLGITLDGELLTAPSVRAAIAGGSARITGSFTQREAEEVANGLNNPLDVELRIAEMYEVGPTMAADAVKSGTQAFIIGAAVVVFFMLIYYMVAGIVALAAVIINLVIVCGTLSSLGATVTLPGVAALVLTIGMAVDANILIYERIREELRAGKTLKNSLLGGFEKAFSTIVDANVTTLITAFILIYFGTGPVKGFGVTLAIGIGSTMFCALIVSRFLLDLLINTGVTKRMLTVSLFKEVTTFKFLNYRKYAFITSWIIVIVGISMTIIKRDDIQGIDFTGGDEISLHFQQELSVTEVESVATNLGIDEINLTLQTPLGANAETVLKIATPFEQGQALFDGLIDAYPSKGLTLIGTNQIGPTVGKEILVNAFVSIGVALICILLYVALRFEVGFGVGAVVATVHDLFMTIGIFVLFGNQFSAPMVAALLMIVGYSLNDTIVVFDRIREELELNPGLKLNQVVNLAINRTLSRTILTSLTTLLVTVSLLIFGTGIIRDFAFTFVVGILTGTFSSIFIASPVFYWWHKGDRRHVESHSDVLPKYEWEAGGKSKG
ncbi:MAG: protein translocase subunit SecD [Verrucomicrobia bacterium]|nr:protein translocase subunit SecD [Verrucomicrobiota bacterium]